MRTSTNILPAYFFFLFVIKITTETMYVFPIELISKNYRITDLQS